MEFFGNGNDSYSEVAAVYEAEEGEEADCEVGGVFFEGRPILRY